MQTDLRTFYAKDRNEWRNWLREHATSDTAIWLILYRKNSGVACITYEEAVEEALCYGWIDSKAQGRDQQSHLQSFSKRKPKSKWSKPNKERVERMMQEGKMTALGMDAIKIAKENGSWNILDASDNLTVPDDLQQAFTANTIAQKNFEAFPPSARKNILQWIADAKREATRTKRIQETVNLAEQNIRARQ